MANRAYRLFHKSLDRDKVRVWAQLNFGASAGAVTSFQGPECTLAKNVGVGQFELQFDPTGYGGPLIGVNCIQSQPSTVSGVNFWVTASGISTSGVIQLNCVDPAGQLTNPPAGCNLMVEAVWELSTGRIAG